MKATVNKSRSTPLSKTEFKSVKVHVDVDDKLYLKDPNSSELGRKVIKYSIEMMDEMGFESFTFKKLADRIGASEPSVYRYFESKHKLLLYLLAWYWNWMDYRIALATNNISSPEQKLKLAIQLLSQPIEKDQGFEHVDETALYRIVVAESSKVYLTKEVDKVNKEGLFISYKRLCNHVAAMIHDINPDYRFSRALISTVIESSHDQKFFAEHLPSLTEVTRDKLNDATEFLTEMVLKTIRK